LTSRETASSVSSWRDAALGGGQIERHVGARARDLAPVDLLLGQPVVDRGLAHVEGRDQLGHLRARAGEPDDLSPEAEAAAAVIASIPVPPATTEGRGS
jgi:hypothetical protein